MVTDNFPRSYVYISRRILRDLWDQHQAHGPRIRPKEFASSVAGIGAKFGVEDNSSNYFWLARKVPDLISDNTGTLDSPGPYCRAEMDVTWGICPLMQNPVGVAWLTCRASTDDGEVLASLCGSVSNLVGFDASTPSSSRGWYPSSGIPGFNRVTQAFSNGADDPNGAAMTVKDSSREELEVIASTAYTIGETLGHGHIAGRARLDVLFQVFGILKDIRFILNETEEFSSVFLGTPVWAVITAPRAATPPFLDDDVLRALGGLPSHLNDGMDYPTGSETK